MVRDWPTVLSSVKAALMRRGRSSHDADDLVQEAWLRLACYDGSELIRRPEAFLMRTALNLSIDDYRVSAVRGEHVQLDELQIPDERSGIEAQMIAKERLGRVSDCLMQLETRTRRIFVANRVDGQGYDAIAKAHRLSVSAVEKHIARAVAALADAMKGV